MLCVELGQAVAWLAPLLTSLPRVHWGEPQITLMKQDRAPALTDNNASIARDGTYGIVTKPRGHGDVHSLIQKHGLAKKWADEGRKFVCFFQDTNGSCFFNIAAGLGVAAKHDYNVSGGGGVCC